MRYCSFVVWAPGTVELPEHLLIIERGMNAFSILVEDVAGFKKKLTNAGVVIKQDKFLDEFDPVPAIAAEEPFPLDAAPESRFLPPTEEG